MDVLVTAASRNGSTAEIGRVIARLLEARELNVVVAEPEEVERLDDYDAVIIGSAVYAGHWLEPAAAFVRRHESQLRERPVFVFSTRPPASRSNPTRTRRARVDRRPDPAHRPSRLRGPAGQKPALIPHPARGRRHAGPVW